MHAKTVQSHACFVSYFLIIGTVFFASVVTADSQTKRLAELPSSDVYSVVMSQTGNTLLIVNPRTYFNLVTKRVEFSFGVRNIGKRPIAGFQVSALWDMGSGGTLGTSWSRKDNKKILLPGQQIDEVDKESFKSVPYTLEIREQIKFKTSPSRLHFFIVE